MRKRKLTSVDCDPVFPFQSFRLRGVCAHETRLAPRYVRVDRGRCTHPPAQMIDQMGLHTRFEIHDIRSIRFPAVSIECVFWTFFFILARRTLNSVFTNSYTNSQCPVVVCSSSLRTVPRVRKTYQISIPNPLSPPDLTQPARHSFFSRCLLDG